MIYQRILVSTGESPWSDAAVAHAIALARCTSAELCLLTVLNTPASCATSENIQDFDLVMDVVKHRGERRLHQAMALATQADVAYTPVLRWDTNIAQAILRTASEEACGLIVLGSRPITGRRRLRLSRVAQAVAATACQPTLVVKPPQSATPVALPWQRVLVAVESIAGSEAAIAHAVCLAQTQGGTVCFAASAGVAYETRLAYGDMVAAIVRTAKQAQCDAIILGRRGGPARLRLESLSYAVLTATRLPVLIVKY
jgi:nucleotide-binding universal stress UspA family protein